MAEPFLNLPEEAVTRIWNVWGVPSQFIGPSLIKPEPFVVLFPTRWTSDAFANRWLPGPKEGSQVTSTDTRAPAPLPTSVGEERGCGHGASRVGLYTKRFAYYVGRRKSEYARLNTAYLGETE